MWGLDCWYILEKRVTLHYLFSPFLNVTNRRAEDGLNGVSSNPRSPLNWPNHAFGKPHKSSATNPSFHVCSSIKSNRFFSNVSLLVVSGMGFGMMSGVTSYIRSLAESSGPGVMQCESCPSADVFFIGGTNALFPF